MRAIAVIPTYNERESLPRLVEQIRSLAAPVDMLIVDDNSPDGTGQVAEELAAAGGNRMLVLHREKKEGLGRAYLAGFRQALDLGYEVILQMDADLSHDPAYILGFLDRIQNCDLVLGSRYIGGIRVVNWDFKRLLLSKTATKYVQNVTGMRFSDTTGGFKCWRASALRQVGLEGVFSNGYLEVAKLIREDYFAGGSDTALLVNAICLIRKVYERFLPLSPIALGFSIYNAKGIWLAAGRNSSDNKSERWPNQHIELGGFYAQDVLTGGRLLAKNICDRLWQVFHRERCEVFDDQGAFIRPR